MGNRIRGFMAGRNGVDTLGKTQLLIGVLCMPLTYLFTDRLGGYPSFLLQILSLVMLTMSLIRLLSRNVDLRRAQNERFLNFFRRIRANHTLRLEHHAQRADFKFFKCPGCGAYLRVPRGKGKISINCRCGYILYRKT